VAHYLDDKPVLADPGHLALHGHPRLKRLAQRAQVGHAAAGARALAHNGLAVPVRDHKPAHGVSHFHLVAGKLGGLDQRLVLSADVDVHVLGTDTRHLAGYLIPRRKGLDLLVVPAEHGHKLAGFAVVGGFFVKEAVMFLV